MAESSLHEPVLLRETLSLLAPEPGEVVVDATLGGAGHAEALLDAVGPGGRLLGIDRDRTAIDGARKRLARFGPSFVPLRGDHRELRRIVESAGITVVDRVLFDLGLSSMQLADPARGFSFDRDGPLDMRMDPDTGPSAADLLETLSEEELSRILWCFGEERRSRAIARAVVRERSRRPIRTTGELALLAAGVLGASARRYRIHPATRTFQALRIAVNGELDGLDSRIRQAVSLLRPGGRLAVIAFHSLEDRAVKHELRDLARACTCPPQLPVCGCGTQNLLRLLTPKAVRPPLAEVQRNPRSRSARLRAAERR